MITPEQIAKVGTESAHQKALFCWGALNADTYPMLKLMHAIPNGGKRDIATAARLKAEGVKAGVPDIFLPYPNKTHHGLYIEMKIKGGKVSDKQSEFISKLINLKYDAIVCYNWIEAKEYIEHYINR